MARIYKQDEYNVKFTPSKISGKFTPETPYDPSRQILQDNQQHQKDFATIRTGLQRQNAVNNQVLNAERAKANAGFATVKGLLSMTQSGIKLAGAIEDAKLEKQKYEDAQAFLAPGMGASVFKNPDPPELPRLEAAAEQSVNSDLISFSQVQGTQKAIPDDPVAVEDIVAPQADAASARAVTKVDAHTGASRLYPKLTEYMDRNDVQIRLPDGRIITPSQARTEDDIAAVADVALSEISKGLGVDQMDPDTLMTVFLGAAKGAYSNVVAATWSARSAIAKEERVASQRVLLQQRIQDGSMSQQQIMDSLYQGLWTTNNYTTAAKVTEAAVKMHADALFSREDVNGLIALSQSYKVRNADGTYNKGTKFADIPEGDYIMQKIDDLQRNASTRSKQALSQLTDDYYRQLINTPDQADRATLTQQFKPQFEAIQGGAKVYQTLARDLSSTKSSADQLVFEGILEDQIRDGLIGSPETVDRLEAQGQISPEGADRLNEIFNENGKPLETEQEDRIEARIDGIMQDFRTATGLSKDKVTGEISISTSSLFANAANAAAVTEGLEFGLLATAREAFRQAEGSTNQRMIKAVEAMRAYYQDNVLDPNGAYHIPRNLLPGEKPPGTQTDWRAVEASKNTTRDRLNKLARQTGLLMMPYGGAGLDSRNPVQFHGDINNDGSFNVDPQTLRGNFNMRRGDQLFTPDTAAAYRQHYLDTGALPDAFVRVAQQLQINPKVLFNHQLRSHGLDEVVDIPTFQPVSATGGDFTSAREGMQYLISRNVPIRGAAFLAGNIQQESSFIGQRPYWVLDDGAGRNGGLVSWNRGRLARAEAALGRPLSLVSNKEQLDYMLKELETSYPQAHAIFMNEHATDRQLMRASMIYWGYGEEGARFQYAQELLN